MSDAINPVTLFNTSFSGVLATATVGRGQVKQEIWSQTTYPNGATVTRINHYTVEVYDNRGSVTSHNQPNQIDTMI